MKKARGLKKILGAGLIGLASLLPMKSNAQTWDVNPYIQPRSRIEDQSWNKLWIEGSKEDRINYVDSLYAKDKTDTIQWDDAWKCFQNAHQVEINLSGFPELTESPIYNLENNGKNGNIPLYVTEIVIPGKDNHYMNSILVNENYKDFNSWLNIESNDDSHPTIGASNLPKDCKVVIKKTIVKESQSQGKYLESIPFMKFKIENGIPKLDTVYTEHPNLNLKFDKPKEDKDAPLIKIDSPKSDTLYEPGEVEFDFEVEDPEGNLDSVLYSLDGKNWIQSEKELKKTQIFNEGNYKLYVKANDWSPGNKINRSIDSVNFKVKDTSTGMNLEERTRKNNFKVYPNPAKDRIYFKSENPGESRLKIYNIQGQELEEIIFNNEMEYDFAKYNPGIYFYKTESGESGKIIKK